MEEKKTNMTPDGFEILGPEVPDPFTEKAAETPEWFNNEEKAREAAAEFGMTPEEMAAAGMYPDGTPYDSGPAATDPREEDDFAAAVENLGDESGQKL